MSERRLPPAMQWTLLDFGSDMMVVVRAFSDRAPVRAELVELAAAPQVRSGAACRFALRVFDAAGGRRFFAMDEVPRRDQARVLGVPSVVVVEEDAEAPEGRRFSYVAGVVRLQPDAAVP